MGEGGSTKSLTVRTDRSGAGNWSCSGKWKEDLSRGAAFRESSKFSGSWASLYGDQQSLHYGRLCPRDSRCGQLPACELRELLLLTNTGGWEVMQKRPRCPWNRSAWCRSPSTCFWNILLNVSKWLHIIVWTHRKSVIKYTRFQIKGNLILSATSVILYPKSLTNFLVLSQVPSNQTILNY